MSTHLLIIDPQNDFVAPTGALSVTGADADMDRLAALIRRKGAEIDTIHVTLDSHRILDVSHPRWWVDGRGAHPAPFTVISAAHLESGRWTTADPASRERTLEYLRTLDAGGRYPHVIWPEHCLIGDPGHNVWPALSAAIHDWERATGRSAEFVLKGMNPWTEHFSAVRAEVPDPADPGTEVNAKLVADLEAADTVLVAGEALSHCLLSTVEDLARSFANPGSIRKLVLLTDATSPVGDIGGATLFADRSRAFVADMTARGMRVATTVSA